VIRKSSNYGVYVSSGSPEIKSGQITDNPTYGIYNGGSNIISAKNIWWGDATGPYDPSDDTATGGWYNPVGLGNRVTDKVAYQPWATGSVDTDGDGISDEDEINVYGTDPNKADTDGDGLSDFDEVFIYGTDPLNSDTGGDGISDGDEVAFWGENWNADADGDGIINLLDWDSDNDGYSDGVEKAQGTDPADDTSYPEVIVYEDAQDGLTLGWQISDALPAGALVTNIFDNTLQSYVIHLSGDGLLDSFRLYTEEGADWNNANHKVISWTMNFSGDYVLTVLVETSSGLRHLIYTPEEVSNLGSGTEIHHGLGAASKDGSWQTFTVDLQYDLQEAQPGNTILSVQGFMVSGDGLVDDIKTLHQLPPGLDSDGDGLTDSEEINTYGTHPYDPDSDGDTLDDGAELTFWGASWLVDLDADGLINLLDPDADGDGIDDGVELTGGTDPADPASFPAQ
jgi:hypothetical protein